MDVRDSFFVKSRGEIRAEPCVHDRPQTALNWFRPADRAPEKISDQVKARNAHPACVDGKLHSQWEDVRGFGSGTCEVFGKMMRPAETTDGHSSTAFAQLANFFPDIRLYCFGKTVREIGNPVHRTELFW